MVRDGRQYRRSSPCEIAPLIYGLDAAADLTAGQWIIGSKHFKHLGS